MTMSGGSLFLKFRTASAPEIAILGTRDNSTGRHGRTAALSPRIRRCLGGSIAAKCIVQIRSRVTPLRLHHPANQRGQHGCRQRPKPQRRRMGTEIPGRQRGARQRDDRAAKPISGKYPAITKATCVPAASLAARVARWASATARRRSPSAFQHRRRRDEADHAPRTTVSSPRGSSAIPRTMTRLAAGTCWTFGRADGGRFSPTRKPLQRAIR